MLRRVRSRGKMTIYIQRGRGPPSLHHAVIVTTPTLEFIRAALPLVHVIKTSAFLRGTVVDALSFLGSAVFDTEEFGP